MPVFFAVSFFFFEKKKIHVNSFFEKRERNTVSKCIFPLHVVFNQVNAISIKFCVA